jgi:glycolate oxidase FAD binding subunit
MGTFAGDASVPARPTASPATVEEAAEVLRLARAERWSVLPIGHGSKLTWLRPARVDLLLASTNLRGVTAYEPADGTLTALAGTPWSELERVTAARHHLSPELGDAARATVGGTIGSGASGLDRLRHGPLRHQLLGLAALQADGVRVKSGGRVVKNVTGYDLHRLWCGAEGSLCFLLEATLRLYPAPAETLVLRARELETAALLARSHALWRARVQPLAVVARVAPNGTGELAVVLAGRAEAVASEAALVAQHAGPAELLRGAEASAARVELRELEHARGRWAPLVLSTRPSAFAAALATLAEEARALRLAPELTLQPLLARAAVEFPEVALDDARLARLATRLAAAPFQVRWRGLGAATPPPRHAPEAAELMQRLKRSLDPEGVFAGGSA